MGYWSKAGVKEVATSHVFCVCKQHRCYHTDVKQVGKLTTRGSLNLLRLELARKKISSSTPTLVSKGKVSWGDMIADQKEHIAALEHCELIFPSANCLYLYI